MKINRMISKNFPSYRASNGTYMGYNTPKRITFHNTAGGTSAKAFAQSEQTEGGWSAGIPHYYVDKNEIWQVLEDGTVSWANGNYEANDGAITIEIVDGYKNVEDFKKAEKLAIELAKTLVKKYNIAVTDSNFRLHREYVSTACPKRSADLHGGTTKTRRFFMDGVKSKSNGGITYDVWNVKNQNGANIYFYAQSYENGKQKHNQLDNDKNRDVYYWPEGYKPIKAVNKAYLYHDKNLTKKWINSSGNHSYIPKGKYVVAKFVCKVTK